MKKVNEIEKVFEVKECTFNLHMSENGEFKGTVLSTGETFCFAFKHSPETKINRELFSFKVYFDGEVTNSHLFKNGKEYFSCIFSLFNSPKFNFEGLGNGEIDANKVMLKTVMQSYFTDRLGDICISAFNEGDYRGISVFKHGFPDTVYNHNIYFRMGYGERIAWEKYYSNTNSKDLPCEVIVAELIFSHVFDFKFIKQKVENDIFQELGDFPKDIIINNLKKFYLSDPIYTSECVDNIRYTGRLIPVLYGGFAAKIKEIMDTKYTDTDLN